MLVAGEGDLKEDEEDQFQELVSDSMSEAELQFAGWTGKRH